MAKVNVYNILVGKPEGKKPFGRSRRRWKHNMEMDIWETCFEVRIGLIGVSIGIGGRHMCSRQ
jgi:hypothetical protein